MQDSLPGAYVVELDRGPLSPPRRTRLANPIRVVLLGHHPFVRPGLRAALDTDPRFEVLGEGVTGAEALHLVREQQPDVVRLDLSLRALAGDGAARERLARLASAAELADMQRAFQE